MIDVSDKEKAHLLMNTSCKDYNENVVWQYDGLKVLAPDQVSKKVKDIISQNITRIRKIQINRREQTRILIGDYVLFQEGRKERITMQQKDYPNEYKAGGTKESGGFYANEGGNGDYSGTIGIDKLFGHKMEDTTETELALFWTFSRGLFEAWQGMYFYMQVKIWKYID